MDDKSPMIRGKMALALSGFLAGLLFAGSLFADQGRELRRVRADGFRPQVTLKSSPSQTDESRDTLFYDDQTKLEFFLTMPDAAKDKSYNVRFTPPYAPFFIVGAQIALFNVFDKMGHPNMKVSVWQSGVVGEQSGVPEALIDTVIVRDSVLVFSTDTTLYYNVVDLTGLQISFGDTTDFHIGIDQYAAIRGDTLAPFLDDGAEFKNDRSILWNGEDNVWSKVIDLYGDPHNFSIRAVITNIQPWFVSNDATHDAFKPGEYALKPAYPNPFNSVGQLDYYVRQGLSYRLLLSDISGRIVATMERGIGAGWQSHPIQLSGLAAGRYNAVLLTPEGTVVQPMTYLK